MQSLVGRKPQILPATNTPPFGAAFLFLAVANARQMAEFATDHILTQDFYGKRPGLATLRVFWR
jgi:hypothetical protein